MSTALAPTALDDLRAALVCTACLGDGCDDCDHTGQQRCDAATGPAEHCEAPRPCRRHDAALIEKAIA